MQPRLFRNIHDRDYLGFWADQTPNARGVADFLGFKKPDVAKVAGVAPSSVRFDRKIPREVLERLEEIANICALVAQFFEGDVAKTALWFRTRSPRTRRPQTHRWALRRRTARVARRNHRRRPDPPPSRSRLVRLDATTGAAE